MAAEDVPEGVVSIPAPLLDRFFYLDADGNLVSLSKEQQDLMGFFEISTAEPKKINLRSVTLLMSTHEGARAGGTPCFFIKLKDRWHELFNLQDLLNFRLALRRDPNGRQPFFSDESTVRSIDAATPRDPEPVLLPQIRATAPSLDMAAAAATRRPSSLPPIGRGGRRKRTRRRRRTFK